MFGVCVRVGEARQACRVKVLDVQKKKAVSFFSSLSSLPTQTPPALLNAGTRTHPTPAPAYKRTTPSAPQQKKKHTLAAPSLPL